MARYWTHHWQNCYWNNEDNPEYQPISAAGSNRFKMRGVQAGDIVYIITIIDGQLYLGGKMLVYQIVSRNQAVRILNNPYLYQDASDWVINQVGGSPLNLYRRLSPEISHQLSFLSPSSEIKRLFFDSPTHLNRQATRGVRELTFESASLLDRIIDLTDQLPRSKKINIVTKEMINEFSPDTFLPEEVPTSSKYREGSTEKILVNRYERNQTARKACIEYYGATCFICNFDFKERYGEIMNGFIHVHHIKSLASIGEQYDVDPIEDLRPVCPNCHAVLHHRNPPYSLDEIRKLLKRG